MTVTDFITGFIFPHENAYAPGHDGESAYVIAEHVANDAGGTTKYGIDAASHPEVDIENLTAPQATAIYLTEYNAVQWSIPGLSTPALPEFPYPSSFAFFDCREVCGLHAAWLCAQRAANVADDGVPGLFTRNAIVGAPAKTFTLAMIEERIRYHHLVVQAHPTDAPFLQGWLNRCNDLKSYLLA